jgi:anaerobic selenocysteine-containing dehydrogenase
MREFHPDPLHQINPADAEIYGISEGDWVWVESSRKHRFKQKALITPAIKPGVVHAEHAWWFPEKEAAEPVLFGVFDSNPNNLTKADECGQSHIGSAIKSMLCRIYKVQEGDTMPSEQVTRLGGF